MAVQVYEAIKTPNHTVSIKELWAKSWIKFLLIFFLNRSLKRKRTYYNFPEGASHSSCEHGSGWTPRPIKPQMTPANGTWEFAVTHWSHGTVCTQYSSWEFTIHFEDDTMEQAGWGSQSMKSSSYGRSAMGQGWLWPQLCVVVTGPLVSVCLSST